MAMYRWVESPGLPTRLSITALILVVYLVLIAAFLWWAVGLAALLRAIAFSPVGGAWSETVVFYFMFVAAPVAVLLMSLYMGTVRIGLGDPGLRIVTRLRTRDVPWESIRPGWDSPKGEWTFWRFHETRRTGPSIFWLTRDQARAVLSDPKAPSALFPPEVWTWAGLTPPPSYHVA